YGSGGYRLAGEFRRTADRIAGFVAVRDRGSGAKFPDAAARTGPDLGGPGSADDCGCDCESLAECNGGTTPLGCASFGARPYASGGSGFRSGGDGPGAGCNWAPHDAGTGGIGSRALTGGRFRLCHGTNSNVGAVRDRLGSAIEGRLAGYGLLRDCDACAERGTGSHAGCYRSGFWDAEANADAFVSTGAVISAHVSGPDGIFKPHSGRELGIEQLVLRRARRSSGHPSELAGCICS